MKLWFCSGSRTSRSAADGSPRKSIDILSTSSSRNTGFIVPAFFIIWMIWPGNAPMYVRRWPRISASSRTPPSDSRTNLRFIARAIDLASEVLPTPGGPENVRIVAFGFLMSELAGIVHADGGNHRVVMQVVRQLDVLLEQRHHAAHRALRIDAGLFVLRD